MGDAQGMGMKVDQGSLEARALANNITLKEQIAEGHRRLAESQMVANERWQRLAAEAKWPIAKWLFTRWAMKGEARVAKNRREHQRYLDKVEKLRGNG